MFASWSKKELVKEDRDEEGLVQQLIDKLKGDGGDHAGAQLVAGE
jgi:hypothetical protein